MNEVTLKVNQEALVRNLKFGFTSQVTVPGELMQNARRAKASVVAFDYEESSHCLTVTDDSIGIGDLQQLVTVAESGWDAETIEREHPYGLGLLAAVYASEHITVESAGRRLAFATADLLAFRPLAVETYDTGSGTRIVLEGLREIPNLEAALRHRAMGFPIEVRYNGVQLPRPRALDGGFSFERTEVGEVYLYGAMPGRTGRTPPTRSPVISRGSRPTLAVTEARAGAPRSSISIRRASSHASPIGTGSSTSPRRSTPCGRRSRRWPSRACKYRRCGSPPRRSSGGSGHCGTGALSRS
jgi:hypothetical protein